MRARTGHRPRKVKASRQRISPLHLSVESCSARNRPLLLDCERHAGPCCLRVEVPGDAERATRVRSLLSSHHAGDDNSVPSAKCRRLLSPPEVAKAAVRKCGHAGRGVEQRGGGPCGTKLASPSLSLHAVALVWIRQLADRSHHGSRSGCTRGQERGARPSCKLQRSRRRAVSVRPAPQLDMLRV